MKNSILEKMAEIIEKIPDENGRAFYQFSYESVIENNDESDLRIQVWKDRSDFTFLYENAHKEESNMAIKEELDEELLTEFKPLFHDERNNNGWNMTRINQQIEWNHPNGDWIKIQMTDSNLFFFIFSSGQY
jgi:hypothetical protein